MSAADTGPDEEDAVARIRDAVAAIRRGHHAGEADYLLWERLAAFLEQLTLPGARLRSSGDWRSFGHAYAIADAYIQVNKK